MKEFSLEEYLKNPDREVVTRDGRKVRIICTDRAGLNTKPIVALITLPNRDENVKTFWNNGFETTATEGENDLFFAPSKHTDYINLYYKENGYYLGGTVFNSAEKAKEIASESRYYLTTIKAEWED